ncbi:transposase [Frankia sp. CcWB2]
MLFGGTAGRAVAAVLGLPGFVAEVLEFETDGVAARWARVAWHTAHGAFVSAGGHGLLGVVETRARAPVIAWLRAQPAAWRDGIRAVTIDMSTTYRAVAREALPHAMVAADHFHVAQHLGRMCDDVR